MRLSTRELTPRLWPQVELLFGKNGACAGCWCQAWRIEKGERMKDVFGPTAKRRFRHVILNGSTHGILAFDGNIPVGWLNFGPRDSFPRLNRARTLQCDDSAQVWSIPCFFVRREYRGKGVAKIMLKHALKALRQRGVKIAEGYPSKPNRDGTYIPAFAWTGTISLFEKAGFATAGNPQSSKRRVRKQLRRNRSSKS